MPLHFGFSMRRFIIRRTACKGAAAKCFICSPPRRQPFPRRQPKRTRLIRARPFPRTNGMSPLYLCLILSRAKGKGDVNIFHLIAISAMVSSWISRRLHYLFWEQAVSASPRSGSQLKGRGAARFLSPIPPTRTNINVKPVSRPFAAGVFALAADNMKCIPLGHSAV